jgi:putative membrane protein
VADPPVPEGETSVDARVTFANERTYLAWIRTSLALIGGGVAAGAVLRDSPAWGRIAVAIVPILMGLAATVIGYRRWEANDRALRAGRPLPVDRTLHRVAIGIGAIAIAAGIAIIVIIAHG